MIYSCPSVASFFRRFSFSIKDVIADSSSCFVLNRMPALLCGTTNGIAEVFRAMTGVFAARASLMTMPNAS